jgi:Transposase and inactivated derivatives
MTQTTIHLEQTSGKSIEVDWAGKTLEIHEQLTGEIAKSYILFPYSRHAYVQATLTQTLEDWIDTHIKMLQYFQGVLKLLIPDDLKTGLSKHTKTEIIIQQQYQEMAEHYNITIYLARARNLKDKASVENTVSNIGTWIMAKVRNETFFGIETLNDCIATLLTQYNQKDFQKRIST